MKKVVIAITLTDHYQQKPGREWITDELILKILKELDGLTIRNPLNIGEKEKFINGK